LSLLVCIQLALIDRDEFLCLLHGIGALRRRPEKPATNGRNNARKSEAERRTFSISVRTSSAVRVFSSTARCKSAMLSELAFCERASVSSSRSQCSNTAC
jgi:hypothetical protein